MTDAPAFILVRPQMAENIGGAARAMLNFGLDRLRIVDPRDGWPNPRAIATASGAGRLFDYAGPFADVKSALFDADYVYATTARNRDLMKPVLTPERAMAEARLLTQSGKKVAILFGPERAGLENDDVIQANAIITVPVNPDFFSLNLAQCVLLMAYEWGRQTIERPEEIIWMAGTDFASAVEVDKLGDHFEDRLGAAGFFHPPEKVASMKSNLRNMWTRLRLTRAEVQTFHGMLRQIAWKLKKTGQD
jgi:tRNA/rRNA methyltransferase